MLPDNVEAGGNRLPRNLNGVSWAQITRSTPSLADLFQVSSRQIMPFKQAETIRAAERSAWWPCSLAPAEYNQQYPVTLPRGNRICDWENIKVQVNT